MVLASPGPLLTPPPSSFPPTTPKRSYSAQTPPRNGNPTPPPPGGRGGLRQGLGTGRQNWPQADADALRHPRHSATTLQPTKRQPTTAGAVERGGRVTTADLTRTLCSCKHCHILTSVVLALLLCPALSSQWPKWY
jgi:hypothetical protein